MYLLEYFSVLQLSIMLITIVFSYIIFGMVGFGTALIASPVLLNFLPLSQIIPLLALLDMFAAISNVIKDGKKADFSELKFLIPLMFVGSFLGFIVLMRVNASYALLAFGIFTLLYAIYSLSGFKPQKKLEKKFVFPFGLSGGFLGAMFGSGGFLYAIYLNGRIETPEKIRVTQTTLIGCSTVFRVILFTTAGVYFSDNLFSLALLFIPSMLIGAFIGKRITLKLSKQQFLKIINIIVLLSGISIIVKYTLTI
ncbi:sulfite exporter TauE/SafE family protein [Acinetobacter sp. V89_4]|uniref:sulfite exporter TauE/SafE family protein n=1 Tax=Acinetobacter sp. V89_4 TaxID=3044232 RepID=UPI00249E91E2|nr:sulfite exporter TauE/SafE family protein [Acinetobacter sp. V89_4]MDI3452887.1 sulfite exporter TauE/SafE family protein [Acinetobacter sp. V89_4]